MPSIVWKGQLTFGLISIPVKLYRAARRERIRMHYMHRSAASEPPSTTPWNPPDEEAGPSEPPLQSFGEAAAREKPEPLPLPPPVTRVRQSLVSSTDEQPLRRADILRGIEVEPDRYVVFDPDELRELRRKTSSNMEIIRSVRLAEIDPVFLETSYYVVPDRGGEKPYAILFEALRATQHVTLARVGMHGREHVVIVRPGNHGILAHTMFYTDEIRSETEFRTDVQSVGDRELALAKTFLDAIAAPFAPEEFKDMYREELQALIAKKRAESGTAASVAEVPAAEPPADILEALKKSIALARKPPSQEIHPVQRPPEPGTAPQAKRPRKAR